MRAQYGASAALIAAAIVCAETAPALAVVIYTRVHECIWAIATFCPIESLGTSLLLTGVVFVISLAWAFLKAASKRKVSDASGDGEPAKIKELVSQGLKSIMHHVRCADGLSASAAEQKVLSCFREKLALGNGLFDALFATHDELVKAAGSSSVERMTG